MKKKENENEMLEKKINLLIEKISQEENIIKKYKNIIKCKMLTTEMDKNIKFKEAKEELEMQKEKNGITAREEKIDLRTKIIETNKKINSLKQELKLNIYYDFESSRFMFEKEDIEKIGGINQYIKELINSGEPDKIEVAKKIQDNMDKKIELKNLERQLKEQQNDLKNVNKNLKNKNIKTSVQKTALEVRNSKANIFAKIRNFVSSATSGIKEFCTEVMENIKIHNKKMEIMKHIQNEYMLRCEKIRDEYENEMKELISDRYKLEEYAINEIEAKKSSISKIRRNKQAIRFQEELKKMAQKDMKHDEGNKEQDKQEDISIHDEEKNKKIDNLYEEAKQIIDKNGEFDERVKNLCKKMEEKLNKAKEEENKIVNEAWDEAIKENEEFEKNKAWDEAIKENEEFDKNNIHRLREGEYDIIEPEFQKVLHDKTTKEKVQSERELSRLSEDVVEVVCSDEGREENSERG